jgi:hypothetical protein
VTAARDPGGFAKCGKAGEPDHVFHRSHKPIEDAAQGFFAFPESRPVRFDPSIRTAGEVASEIAKHADEYPDLASVPGAPSFLSSSIPRDDSGDETIRTEIAS